MKSEDLFNIAQAHYTALLNNHDFVSSPDYFKFPLPLPHYKATAYVLVNKGRIKEIEIHYENIGIQTVRKQNS
jgi:hypothetical protein